MARRVSERNRMLGAGDNDRIAARTRTLRFACAWLVLVSGSLALGCTGSAPPGNPTDASTASTDSPTTHPSGPCPATTPAGDSPCTLPDGGYGNPYPICEYGSSPDVHCNTTAQCTANLDGGSPGWALTPPDPTCGQNPQGCPANFAGLAGGSACPAIASSASCRYPEGLCSCVGCLSDAGVQGTIWNCRPWVTPSELEPGCPSPRAPLGSACTTEGTECFYIDCCTGPPLGPVMQCSGGTWLNLYGGYCSCAQLACP